MSHYFCPACGNLLLIDTAGAKTLLKCRSCSFQMDFVGQKVRQGKISPLDVEAFVVQDDASKFQNKTEAKCEKCGHNEASFFEIQIRSADEPATLFFCCTKCQYKWREG